MNQIRWASQDAVQKAISPAVTAAFAEREQNGWDTPLPHETISGLRGMFWNQLNSVPGMGRRDKARKALMRTAVLAPKQGVILGDLLGFHEYRLAQDILGVCADLGEDPKSMTKFGRKDLRPLNQRFKAKHKNDKSSEAPAPGDFLAAFHMVAAETGPKLGQLLDEFVEQTGSYARRDKNAQTSEQQKIAALKDAIGKLITDRDAATTKLDFATAGAKQAEIAAKQAELDALEAPATPDDDADEDEATVVAVVGNATIAALKDAIGKLITDRDAATTKLDFATAGAKQAEIAAKQAELDALEAPATPVAAVSSVGSVVAAVAAELPRVSPQQTLKVETTEENPMLKAALEKAATATGPTKITFDYFVQKYEKSGKTPADAEVFLNGLRRAGLLDTANA